MAKSKKRKSSDADDARREAAREENVPDSAEAENSAFVEDAEADSELVVLPEEDLSDEAGGRRFGVGSYLLLIGIFIAFCVFQGLIAAYFLRESRGLFFFFGLLIAAFIVVAIFDFLYDRMASRRTGSRDSEESF